MQLAMLLRQRRVHCRHRRVISTVVPSPTVPAQKKDEIPPGDKNNEITQPEGNQVLPSEEQNSVQLTDKTTDKTDNNKHKNPVSEQEQVTLQQKQDNNAESQLPKAVLTENKERETFAPDDEVASFQKKNVEVDPNTGERKKVARDYDSETDPSQDNARNNSTIAGKKNKTEPNFIETDHKDLHDLVSVQSNNYVRGAFGGIRGLELTVSNNSDYLIDEVSVELQIMKPSEQPLRTDIITFKNIGSNKSITVKVPDSQRGIRVDYRITNIESKQWQKSTAGL